MKHTQVRIVARCSLWRVGNDGTNVPFCFCFVNSSYLVTVVMVACGTKGRDKDDKDHQGHDDARQPGGQGPRLVPGVRRGRDWRSPKSVVQT